jgi:hypothetical protein
MVVAKRRTLQDVHTDGQYMVWGAVLSNRNNNEVA